MIGLANLKEARKMKGSRDLRCRRLLSGALHRTQASNARATNSLRPATGCSEGSSSSIVDSGLLQVTRTIILIPVILGSVGSPRSAGEASWQV